MQFMQLVSLKNIVIKLMNHFILQVVKIVSRKEAPDGIEHLYEVYWRDGDITFEPVANLSGASDALRQFLEKNFPEDALLKVLSALNDSDGEENGPENNIGKEEKLSWLAKWHQKTTRGSTQYWLRKGDDHPDTPSLLKRAVMQEMKGMDILSKISLLLLYLNFRTHHILRVGGRGSP